MPGVNYICNIVNHTQVITLYQPTLESIAFRMLGCIADAEDVVHDTFLKWMTIDTSKIQNTKAFLIRSVTNNCINFLNKGKKEIPETLLSEEFRNKVESLTADFTHSTFDQDSRLIEAWRVISLKLGPVEKAIYVLREAFNVEYEDLQHIVDKNTDNCRKLFSRAKVKLNEELPRINFDISNSFSVPVNLRHAFKFGQLSGLIADLKLDLPRLKKK